MQHLTQSDVKLPLRKCYYMYRDNSIRSGTQLKYHTQMCKHKQHHFPTFSYFAQLMHCEIAQYIGKFLSVHRVFAQSLLSWNPYKTSSCSTAALYHSHSYQQLLMLFKNCLTKMDGTMTSYQYGNTRMMVSFKHSARGISCLSTNCNRPK